jgi:predicted ribosomally synthesized peptide with nif11-like leader
MADVTRAEALVQAIQREPAFQQEVEAAPTAAAKRRILDTHGFQDVTLDDMKAYVESQGGQLVLPPNVRELSDEELDAVVGGLTDAETAGIFVGVGVVGFAAVAAAG